MVPHIKIGPCKGADFYVINIDFLGNVCYNIKKFVKNRSLKDEVTSNLEGGCSMLKNIDYATLKRRTKEGFTFLDFSEKYGCAEEELKEHISKRLCQNQGHSRRLIRDIEQNAKRGARKMSATKAVKAKEDSRAEERNVDMEKNRAVLEEQLEILEKKYEELKGERDNKARLNGRLKALIVKHTKAIEENSVEIERLDGKLAKLVPEIEAAKAELQKMEKVVVLVTASGIELYEAAIPVDLDERGWDRDIFDAVLVEESFDLRRSEYVLLAKALAIEVNLMKADSVSLDVISDIEGFEEAYRYFQGSLIDG